MSLRKVTGIQNIISTPRLGVRQLGLNQTVQLQTKVLPLNATNKGIVWTLTGVGSISQSGLFTAGNVGGPAFIQAISAENGAIKSGLYIINVVIPVTGLTLVVGPKGKDIYRTFTKNTATFVTGIIEPANATNKRIIYTTSNQNIVTINSSGLAMAGPVLGSAVITARAIDQTNGIFTQSVTIRNLL